MRDPWMSRIVWKEWRANRISHLIIIVIISLATMMYGVYSSRPVDERAVAASTEWYHLPFSVMVTYPDWTTRLVNPRFCVDQLIDMSRLDRLTRQVATGVWTHVDTPAGAVEVWGTDILTTDLYRLDEGVHPSPGAMEIAVSDRVLQALSIDLGDSIPLEYLHPDTGEYSASSFTVVGSFSGRPPFERLILANRDEIASLAGLGGYNAAWLWHAPRQSPDAVRRALTGMMPSVRVPAYPLSYYPGDEPPQDNQYLNRYRGLPSPFINQVRPTYWHSESVRSAVFSIEHTSRLSVSALIALMLLLVMLAVTVTVLVVILDRQTTIGIYTVTGMSAEDIGRLFRKQLAVDAAVGSIVGTGLTYLTLLMAPTGSGGGLPLLSVVLWLTAMLALVLWGGRVAWVMSRSRDLSSHLRGDAAFDWWQLVRMWPESPYTAAGSQTLDD